MPRITFSNESTRAVFAQDNCNYADFSKLMFDTAIGSEKVSKEEANKRIREVMFQVIGVDENCSRKELRKAIRRHKLDIFEVIEELIPNLLVSGWGDNPWFDQFVEIKSANLGDTNEFYIEDDVILTVSELAGNHHDIIRQRLGEGTVTPLKTSWYGVKIYTEYELFMAGRVDWAKFVQKIYEAFDEKVNSLVYEAVMAAGSQVLPAEQFNKTGTLTTEGLLQLVQDVQTATGDDVVIMGNKVALSKVGALVDSNWISETMKDERNTLGSIRRWEGVTLAEIPQTFKRGTTTPIDAGANNRLLIMPLADNKFIKVYDEGDARIREIADGDTNMDMTMEYEYQQKMGVGTMIGKKFGVWTIGA